MKKTCFTFKQFVVHQDLAAMKVCTDACLLGALAEFPSPHRLLDVGAGTGLLSFMLAQRYPEASILAVEPEEGAIAQICINLQQNPGFNQIELFPESIQFLPIPDVRWDGLICNPPFYTQHLPSPSQARSKAHHQASLTATDLAETIDRCLAAEGTAWVLYPPQEMEKFLALVKEKNWHPYRWISISHSPNHPVTREYVALQKKTPTTLQREEFSIYTPDGQYDPRFRKLLKDYYIIF